MDWADAGDVALLWPRDSKVPVPAIRRYWMARHVSHAIEGAESLADLFAANLSTAVAGERPLSIVSWRAGSLDAEVAVAARLLARGTQAFHMDCIEPVAELVELGRSRIRDAGFEGYLTVVHGDPVRGRTPGTYDAHLAIGAFSATTSPEALALAIDETMTDSSVLLVADVLRPRGSPLWSETLSVLEQLWPLLLQAQQYDHTSGRFHDRPPSGRAENAPSGDLLSLLETRFDFEEIRGLGGLVDVFVGAEFGPSFVPILENDRRFVDLVCRLEAELRAAKTLSPTFAVGKLRRKDRAHDPVSATPLKRVVEPREAPVLGSIPFERTARQLLLSHEMAGEGDAPFLGDGFFYWEAENGLRWATTQFELRFDLPRRSAPYACTLAVEFLAPVDDPGGALDVFLAGARVAHVTRVFGYLSAAEGHRLELSFMTVGGATSLTFRLERPQRTPDDQDQRTLGLVVRRFDVFGQ